ncbi:hypothetical protein INT43_000489 [Umbelopsis isabellina]|uniref:Neurochondrin-domain-containing protein n=1 Tax=Mortierella isabellina TaxID=91625 RepID=A0A8H7UIQ0_MORIS|nr:hypothetical protein INT43_000489 [Umbelopsis isabellina]
MSVPVSKENRAAEIDQCLKLLSASASDESKFTALLILPRLLDANDENTIQHVFGRMNFKFLERLMKSSKCINSSVTLVFRLSYKLQWMFVSLTSKIEPTAEVPETVMQEIAVNILSFFSNVDSLKSSEDLIARIPTLSTLIKPSDSNDITKEVLMMVMRLQDSELAISATLSSTVLSRILSLLGINATSEEQELAKHLCVLTYGNAFTKIEQQNSQILRTAVLESLKFTLLPTLSSTIRVKQDVSKFIAVDLLHRVLNECPTDITKELYSTEQQRVNIWCENIRSGLRQILTSKTVSDRRDQAFSLIATLLRHIGPNWLFCTLGKTAAVAHEAPQQLEKQPAGGAKGKPVVTEESEIDARFPALLIQLASLEARLILDELGGDPDAGGRKTLQEAPSSDRSIAMLPMFYQIIESGIQYLTSEDLDLQGTDIDLIFKIRNILRELFKAIIDFLNDIQSKHAEQDVFENIVALASVRLLAIWTEEDDSLNEEMSSATLTMVETFRDTQ